MSRRAHLLAVVGLLFLIPSLSFGGGFNFAYRSYAGILSARVKGGRVDYAGLKAQRAGLDEFLTSANRVTTLQYDAWLERDRLAFLLNVYNAETLRLIVDRYPIASIRKIGPIWNPKAPWNLPTVRLFGRTMSLDDLEQRAIRTGFNEPRVHFALVCAAKGCPPLRSEAYEGVRLDAQLDDQARIFLAQADKNRVDPALKRARLSPIFKWYLVDFGGTKPALLDYLRKWLPVEKDWSVSWTDYDWALNEDKK